MPRLKPGRNEDRPFDPGIRPPDEMMPEPLKPYIAEYDRLRAQLGAIEAEVVATDPLYTAGLAEARQADGRAIGQAAREGKTLDNPTAHVDAFNAQRQSLQDRVQAYKEAIKLTVGDLLTVYNQVVDNHTSEAADKARADLVKATALVAKRAQTLVDQLALTDWLKDARRYDASIQLPGTTAAPWLVGKTGPGGDYPGLLADVLDSINNL